MNINHLGKYKFLIIAFYFKRLFYFKIFFLLFILTLSFTKFTTNFGLKSGNELNNQSRLQQIYGVSLQTADKVFYAEAFNRQQAKHKAACQALDYLSKLKLPSNLDNNPDNESSSNITPKPNTNNVISEKISNNPDITYLNSIFQ